jgi:hypothetical protein
MMGKPVSQILDENARLLLIVGGLVLILLGNAFEFSILKIKLGDQLVQVGSLLLIVGLLHWIFETRMKRQFMREIVDTVVGAGRTSSSGIVDFTHNSRSVDYKNIIRLAKQVTIGEHYSSRFFEDHAPEIRARLSRGAQMTAILLKPKTLAFDYLKESGSGHGGIDEQITKIREIATSPNASDAHKNKAGRLQIWWHSRVLRYSFIMTEDLIWVRFFTNSSGYSLVPAICVVKDTQLYDFFKMDVNRLIEHSEHG